MIPDADYAAVVLDAENAFLPGQLEPSLPAYTAANYSLRAYLTALDAIIRPGSALTLADTRAFYGWVLESRTFSGTFLIAIRGTIGAVEWVEDAETAERPHPSGGVVEAGFYGLYCSMGLRLPGGTDAPLMASLQKLIGNGRAIVAGHSLGAALATMFVYDLSFYLLNGRTALRAYASPHPGNSTFAAAVVARTPDAKGWAYERDIVPRVPPSTPWASYCALPGRIELPANANICDTPGCNHHLMSYGYLLAGQDWLNTVGPGARFRSCVTV